MVIVYWPAASVVSASLRRDIWGQAGWLLVGFDEPNGAVVKVAEELLIVRRSHFASPDDLGVIDIGAVVDPLAVNVMLGRIVDDGELAAWLLLEAAQDFRSGEQSGVGAGGAWPNNLADKGGETGERDNPHQETAGRPATETSQAQMAHRLKDQDVEHAGHGRGVVSRHVSLQRQAGEEDQGRQEPEARAAILQDPWKGNQRKSESDSHVETPNQGCLMPGGSQPIVERTLHGRALKAGLPLSVESAHDFVPVDRFGPEGLPEKEGGHGVGVAVHLVWHAERIAGDPEVVIAGSQRSRQKDQGQGQRDFS